MRRDPTVRVVEAYSAEALQDAINKELATAPGVLRDIKYDTDVINRGGQVREWYSALLIIDPRPRRPA